MEQGKSNDPELNNQIYKVKWTKLARKMDKFVVRVKNLIYLPEINRSSSLRVNKLTNKIWKHNEQDWFNGQKKRMLHPTIKECILF